MSSGTASAQQQQQQQQQPEQQQQTQAASGGGGGGGGGSTVKKKLVDRVCPPNVQDIVPEIVAYQEMLDFERRLDLDITRKTLDLQESLKRPARRKRTLRIFLTNLFYTQHDGTPSWELRIEGRLLDPDARPFKRKFSSFLKSLLIELDSAIYGPDNHLIEWHRTTATTETDGFQLRRFGDLPVKCTILFQIENQPAHYKIDPRLARLLGKQSDTRPAVIHALWQYIKTKTLQDSSDREYINNNSPLAQIFECKRMRFSEIPAKLNKLLSPTDPIIIRHSIIRNSGETQRLVYELDVEANSKETSAFMSTAINQELQQLDEKMCDTLGDIRLISNTHDLFFSFGQDPHLFINKWLASQSSSLDLKSSGYSEEERRAEYYYQPWLQEAVCRYFYRKIQERRGDLEVL